VAAQAQVKESALAARRPLQKESEKLEQQLAAWQAELKLLETRLADPRCTRERTAACSTNLPCGKAF
jgi:hypothetical protein